MAINLLDRPADRRAIDLEQHQLSDNPLPANGARAGSDPASAQGRSRNGLNMDGQVVFGRIVDSVAYARMYKVQCDRLGTIRCCDGAHTGFNVTGARSINSYGPNTGVIVYWHPQAMYGVILCAFPDWTADARHGISDFLVSGSNVGLHSDSIHQRPFLMEGGIIDFAAGRPFDGLMGGEWGSIAETGMKVSLDPFLAQMSLDEETGLFIFHFDQLARLAGHNLQMRSAGRDREEMDDENEFNVCDQATPFLWEAMGLASPGTPMVELSAETAQASGSGWKSRFEPLNNDQVGAYRDRRWRGYLGQGGRESVCAPYGSDLHRYSTNTAVRLLGLHDHFVGLDGSSATRSAHSIFLVKDPMIPAPQAVKRPEDPAGDNKTNYKAAGEFGSGPAHVVLAEPTSTGDVSALEVSAVLDLAAYALNWKGQHPFHYHSADWKLHQESALPQAAVVAAAVPAFASLETDFELAGPPSFNVQVDERYGLTKYFANRAHIALLPRGGISIVDGWGSEIRMANGHVTIHAAANATTTAGKNIVQMAGLDVVVRANGSVDVSANKGNVSVKAEGNLSLLGGNNRCGGVLVQSMGDGTAFEKAGLVEDDVVGGILLRAKNSTVAALANNIVLSTAAWGVETAGHVVIDAGSSRMITRADQFRRHVGSCCLDIFAGGSVNEWWNSAVRMNGTLVVNGPSYLWGCVTTNSSVVAEVALCSPTFNELSPEQTAVLLDASAAISSRDLSAVASASVDEMEFLFTNSDVAVVEFGFRTTASFSATGFVAHEPVWQQLARLSGQSMPVWSENLVVREEDAAESAPFPGQDSWYGASSFAKTTLGLFDPAVMRAVDRGAAYETAQLQPPVLVSMDGNWSVVFDLT